MTELLGEEVFTRITQEMFIWGSNTQEDGEAQWTSMGIDYECVQALGDLVIHLALGPDVSDEMLAKLAPLVAYMLAFGVRLGREQGWQSRS